MRMVFRWFGDGNDTVTLDQIRQIPGVEGIVWALHDIPVGEEWPMERIQEVHKQAEAYGLHLDVVESVNVHEDIKLGLPSRDHYITNYIRTMEKLAQVGVKVICYNFMLHLGIASGSIIGSTVIEKSSVANNPWVGGIIAAVAFGVAFFSLTRRSAPAKDEAAASSRTAEQL